MKALVAGADQATTRRLRDALREAGLETDFQPDAEAAFAAFGREAFPIVLLDLAGLRRGAPSLVRRLRALPAGRESGIYGLGRPSPAELAELLESGLTCLVDPHEREGSLLLHLRLSQHCAEAQADRARAHEALLESEKRYRAVVEDRTDVICRFQADGTLTFVNEAYCRFFGKPREELLGRSFFPFIPEADRQGVRDGIASLTAERPQATHEHRVLLPGGGVGWQQWTDLAVCDDRGRIVEYQSVGRDVTEWKRAEEALRESEEKYRLLVERSPLGILIAGGLPPRVRLVNRVFCDWLGFSEREIRALEPQALLALAVPEEQALFLRLYEDALAKGLVLSRTQIRVRRRDGKTRVLEVYSSPVEVGGEKAVQAVFVDVTEQRAAEAALRTSEEKYRSLAESSLQGILVVQGNPPRPVYANPAFARMSGAEVREVCSLTPEQMMGFIHPDDRGKIVANFANRMAGRPADSRYEIRFQNRAGGWTWVESYASRIDFGGSPAVQLLYLDITDRRNAEEERRRFESRLQQAQKLESLGVLAGGIAHDINNMLMGVLGYADLAILELPPESAARPFLQEIKAASRRLSDLTRQMVGYTGKPQLGMEPVVLAHLVQEMSNLLRVSIPKNVEIRYEISPGLPSVRGDPTQLRQVFLNLMTNASEAVGEAPGAIRVTLEAVRADRALLEKSYLDEGLPEGRYVSLEVRDTGCGMDEGVKARIFEPFFSTKFQGRGLGLSAVLGIVRSHRGAVQVETEPGKGTLFRLLLPALEGTPGASPARPAPPAAACGQGTVLIVDDEAAVRSVAARMLRRSAFEVLEAADGVEAVETFRRCRSEIALVLLDLTMPRKDGVAAFREIRAERADVPVLLFSGFNQQDVRQRFGEEGFAGFVQKPYDYDTLLLRVREALGRAPRASPPPKA